MKISLLERSQFIATFRNELIQRGLLEIDSLFLMPHGGFDPQIDSLIAVGSQFQSYLHNSPELYLKYLLTNFDEAYSHGVFYLGHVFRDDPKTDFHRKEFLMAEWYRPGFTLGDLRTDTLNLLSRIISIDQVNTFKIHEEFSFNYNEFSELESFLKSQIRMPPEYDYQDLFSLLWIHFIEPKIRSGLVVIEGFPEKLKSMAKVDKDFPHTCKRFEICINGIEIANAYEEETDSAILANNHFLKSSLHKLGLCSGIALGVDRLLACSKNLHTIEDVMYPVIS